MSSPYAQILRVPGTLAFTSTGVLARLPLSMISLGIVILVSSRTGSYTTAGGVSAAYLAANALGSIPLARVVDRRGQGRVIGPAATVSCAALGGLVAAVETDRPAPWPHLFAVLVGLSLPNVGAAIRARWAHVLTAPAHDRRELDTAFALEAVNDEVVFIVGPTLVTFLATAIDPLAGLAAAAAAGLVGSWWLVLQRSTAPPPQLGGAVAGRAPMPWRTLTPLVVCGLLLGALFGACEVATVARCDAAGHKSYAGILLALWALGSLVSGLVVGSLATRTEPAARHRWSLLALATLLLPLPFVPGLVGVGAVLLLAGVAISPTLIAAMSWVELLAPRERLNEGITFYSTGLGAGIAPGAAIAGAVVDRAGAAPAYWVAIGAGLTGALIAFADRPHRAPSPASRRILRS